VKKAIIRTTPTSIIMKEFSNRGKTTSHLMRRHLNETQSQNKLSSLE
jgi:hypothetical protein